MSVQLEIQDGSPWWLSPDIWTVPGADPQGPPGMPVAGEPCYLWARVHNNGSSPVMNAQVRFYWANPSVGFDRNSANLVGSANVSLGPAGGGTDVREVLCLVPWIPTFVNQGHECVLAEAYHTTDDPLPASPDFSVPTDRHVAQRNLSVVMMAKMMRIFGLNFEIHNRSRHDRTFNIRVKPGRIEDLSKQLQQLGRGTLPGHAKGSIAQAAFTKAICATEADLKDARPSVEGLRVGAGQRVGLTVVGGLEGEAALLHVVQESDGREIGGLSVLVVRGAEQAKH